MCLFISFVHTEEQTRQEDSSGWLQIGYYGKSGIRENWKKVGSGKNGLNNLGSGKNFPKKWAHLCQSLNMHGNHFTAPDAHFGNQILEGSTFWKSSNTVP